MLYPLPIRVLHRVDVVTTEDGKRRAVFSVCEDNHPASHGKPVLMVTDGAEPALYFANYVLPISYYFSDPPPTEKKLGAPSVGILDTLPAKIGALYERRLANYVGDRSDDGTRGSYAITEKVITALAHEKNIRRNEIESHVNAYSGPPGSEKYEALRKLTLNAVRANKVPSYQQDILKPRYEMYNRNAAAWGGVAIKLPTLKKGRTSLPEHCEITGEGLDYGERDRVDSTDNCMDLTAVPLLDSLRTETENRLLKLEAAIDAGDPASRVKNPVVAKALPNILSGTSVKQSAAQAKDDLVAELVKEYYQLAPDDDAAYKDWKARHTAALDGTYEAKFKQSAKQSLKNLKPTLGKPATPDAMNKMRTQQAVLQKRLDWLNSPDAERMSGKPLVVCDYVAILLNPWRHNGPKTRIEGCLLRRTKPVTDKRENWGTNNNGYPSIEKIVEHVVRAGTPDQIVRLYKKLSDITDNVHEQFPCIKPDLEVLYDIYK